MENKDAWDWEISSGTKWFQWRLSEIWHYKDLLLRFVRRDLIANYQQTLLGPFWVFLQPVLTTLVYYLIFGRIVKVSTSGIPPILFYLSGILFWGYFSDCLNGTMYTFLQNANVFSKVYFPRLIVPLSSVISHTVRTVIQLLLFIFIYLYYFSQGEITGSYYMLLTPVLLLITAGFGLGAGLIVSVLTARYRDLDYTLQFLLRLFMFATPVVYPTSIVPEQYQIFFWLNPLTAVIETFRAGFFSNEPVYIMHLLFSCVEVLLLILVGITLFKKQELKVIDVI
ncbi:ABC transporter permease [Pinibacter soli]|uniref:Transport permease protein n=1 Tax=Pinibacter soli TaxID=3044211 RepID=A0ABT6RA33_9BACT|nr:ABC transporter permease [Pinibacter soli]MDI3319434.1 ABC transporter permease [Pinibacter soli]